MKVENEEKERREACWVPPPLRFEREYGWMFSKQLEQAPDGCDFDFLKSDFGAPVRDPDIF